MGKHTAKTCTGLNIIGKSDCGDVDIYGRHSARNINNRLVTMFEVFQWQSFMIAFSKQREEHYDRN